MFRNVNRFLTDAFLILLSKQVHMTRRVNIPHDSSCKYYTDNYGKYKIDSLSERKKAQWLVIGEDRSVSVKGCLSVFANGVDSIFNTNISTKLTTQEQRKTRNIVSGSIHWFASHEEIFFSDSLQNKFTQIQQRGYW